jgi:membrane protease YdiL (CAAX protease family)
MSSKDLVHRQLLWFFTLCFVGTMASHTPLVLFRNGLSMTPISPSLYLYLIGIAVPSLAAVFLTNKETRSSFIRSSFALSSPAINYLCAVLAQLGIVALAWSMFLAAGTSNKPALQLSPAFLWLAIGQAWVVVGEELGWRGFALPRLETLFSSRQATLVIALAWGLWHTPMFFVRNSLQQGSSVWLFAASIFAWSAIHTLLYDQNRPSLFGNMLFHGAANVTLNLGLVIPEIEPYLLASFVLVGLSAWTRLSPQRSTPSVSDGPGRELPG